MKVLIGTTNPSKADWLGGLIGAGTELLTLGDVNISAEPSETGATPAENAAIKAEFYGKTFQPVVCHDSGLYFAELALDDPRQPGLHVRTPNGRARFCNDEEMIAYYAALVHSLGGAATAMYLNGFAVFADGKLSTFAFSREDAAHAAFIMTDKPSASRHPGWPLDSISVGPDSGLYFTGEPYCGKQPVSLSQTKKGTGGLQKSAADAELRRFLKKALGL